MSVRPPVTDPVEHLYLQHHGWLVGWLRGKLGAASGRAADLAQDTFVRVLSQRHHEPLRQPRSYLSTIARGLMIDLFRRQDLEKAYLALLESQPAAYALSQEEHAIVLETLYEIDRLLDGLGSKVKQAFLLSQLDGLTYAEIAQEMAISVSSVKKYMLKAVEHCLLHA